MTLVSGGETAPSYRFPAAWIRPGNKPRLPMAEKGIEAPPLQVTWTERPARDSEFL